MLTALATADTSVKVVCTHPVAVSMMQPSGLPTDWQVDTLRPGVLGKNRVEFAARYCGRRLLCSRPGRPNGQKHYDNSGVARPQELRGLLMKVLSRSGI